MSDIKKKITEYAKKYGVDIVGFSAIDRFADFPDNKNPLKIFPEAKSVIGLGFRVLRGSTRGIEEGSTFYQYSTMGVENIDENIIPITLLRLSGFLEDMGYDAVPQRQHLTIMSEMNSTNPEMLHDRIYRGIKHEVQMDFKYAALACGMGEMGFGGQILTPEYGPYQRFCFVLTNAEIESDPIMKPSLCDECGKCFKACPGNAFSKKVTHVKIEDTEFRFREPEPWQCAVYYRGAKRDKNPFMPPDAYSKLHNRNSIMNGEAQLAYGEAYKVLDETGFYPSCRHSFATSVCGRACDRECYIHLEETGKMTKKFTSQFRKRKEWKLPV